MDDFDETFFDSDENPFDLASLLPRRTALDKNKQIADTKQKLWELSCELRRLLEGSGERQVLELFLGATYLPGDRHWRRRRPTNRARHNLLDP
jgi:hypothetical protein